MQPSPLFGYYKNISLEQKMPIMLAEASYEITAGLLQNWLEVRERIGSLHNTRTRAQITTVPIARTKRCGEYIHDGMEDEVLGGTTRKE